MPPKLYILAGIPGCGKTTWTKSVLGIYGDLVWVSSDEIRQEMFGSKYDAAQNASVFERFYKAIDKALVNDRDTIADATNLNAFARTELRRIAENTGAETHLIFFTNVDQAIVRNLNREGKRAGEQRVPDEGMKYMLEKYELARRDIPLEQYETVTYIGAFS